MKGFFELSKVQAERPDAGLIPRCGSCGLLKQCKTPKMKPYGEGLRNILIVGEAPGENEDEEGRPFIGKAGEYLRGQLSRLQPYINMDRDCVTTNALICRPPHNKIDDPRKIDYCRPNLLKTIESVRPDIIITLGRSALASVVEPYWKGDLGILERWIGWQIPLEHFWICPTWHPSYLLRINDEMHARRFGEHLGKAVRRHDKPSPPPDFSSQVELIYDESAIYKAIREMDRQGGWAAFDYETNCIKPELPKSKIISASISNGRRTIAYPWIGDAIRATSYFLQSSNTTKIASNMKFEDRWTRHHLGHPVRNWGWDTMEAAHCIDNRPDITSLKFQAFIHLGIVSYNVKIEPYLKNHRGPYNRIHEVALEDLLLYNGMDSVLEYHVAMKQRKEGMGYDD